MMAATVTVQAVIRLPIGVRPNTFPALRQGFGLFVFDQANTAFDIDFAFPDPFDKAELTPHVMPAGRTEDPVFMVLRVAPQEYELCPIGGILALDCRTTTAAGARVPQGEQFHRRMRPTCLALKRQVKTITDPPNNAKTFLIRHAVPVRGNGPVIVELPARGHMTRTVGDPEPRLVQCDGDRVRGMIPRFGEFGHGRTCSVGENWWRWRCFGAARTSQVRGCFVPTMVRRLVRAEVDHAIVEGGIASKQG